MTWDQTEDGLDVLDSALNDTGYTVECLELLPQPSGTCLGLFDIADEDYVERCTLIAEITDFDEPAIEPLLLTEAHIYSVARNTDTLYGGSSDGVWEWRNGTWTQHAFQDHGPMIRLTMEKSGRLVILSSNAPYACFFEEGSFHPAKTEGLENPRLFNLCQDADGTVHCCGENAYGRLNEDTWILRETDKRGRFQSMGVGEDGTVYLGATAGGTVIVRGGEERQIAFPPVLGVAMYDTHAYIGTVKGLFRERDGVIEQMAGFAGNMAAAGDFLFAGAPGGHIARYDGKEALLLKLTFDDGTLGIENVKRIPKQMQVMQVI